MVYRIRYRSTGQPGNGEAVVEANSPTEAMVKFQYARDGGSAQACREIVTSVRAEDDYRELAR